MRPQADLPRRPRRPRDSRAGARTILIVRGPSACSSSSCRSAASPASTPTTSGSTRSASAASGAACSAPRSRSAVIFTGLFFVLCWVNLLIADRIAPAFRPSGPEEELLERYHEIVGRTGAAWCGSRVAGLFALIAGAGVSRQWNDWILFTHRVDFGQKDATFHTDIGFYVFQLPFLTFVVSWLFSACS